MEINLLKKKKYTYHLRGHGIRFWLSEAKTIASCLLNVHWQIFQKYAYLGREQISNKLNK